jgi:hypothetical protein
VAGGRDAGIMETGVINDQPVMKDPKFWITMAIGFSPLLAGSAFLFWLL